VRARSGAHKLIIISAALAAAEEAAYSRIPRETGGILLGFRSLNGVYVADVAEVPDDHSTGNRFVLREDSREKALARYRHEAPPECPFGYVGNWHSHPAQAHASSRDMRTLRQEAKTAQDLIAMMILMRAPTGSWLVEGAVGYCERTIARQAGRRRTWRIRIVKADPIVRPRDQPTPPGYGIPDGDGNDGST
jgi:hypothetical protein